MLESSLLLVFMAAAGQAQEQLRFDHLTIRDGLSQSFVSCILQDHKGFMWFGTADGLNRYDGYNFQHFKHDPTDPTSLSDSWITALCEDSQGRLWVGTINGLNLFDRAKGCFKRFPRFEEPTATGIRNWISFIAEDGHGNLWIGGMQIGAHIIDRQGEVFIPFRNEPGNESSLSSNSVMTGYVDSRGDLWIGTLQGELNRFDNKKRAFDRFCPRFPEQGIEVPGSVLAICEDAEGNIWAGTRLTGILKVNPAEGKYELHGLWDGGVSANVDNTVYCIFRNLDNNLWVGSTGGLYTFNPRTGQSTVYRNDPADPQSLSFDEIQSCYRDDSGVMWLGTNGQGLSTYSPFRYKFKHYKQNPYKSGGMIGEYVYGLMEDGRGFIWAGTVEGGLNRIDRRSGRAEQIVLPSRFKRRQDFETVWTIEEDRRGDVWFGTSRGEVFRYRPETGGIEFILETAPTRVIKEDRAGNILIGTEGRGLLILRATGEAGAREFEPSSEQLESLSEKRLKCILEDDNGLLWIGCERGLYLYDRESGAIIEYLHDPNDENTIGHDFILSLHKDSQGRIWVGSRGGLSRYLPEADQFITYSSNDGLPNNVIYGILEDERERLWLSTNAGLAVFDPRDGSIETYTESDGLQSNEFNTGSYYKSVSGEMLFGGVRGFNSFFPNSIRKNLKAPAMVLTSFKVFGREANLNRPPFELTDIELPHDRNYISLEFAALDFTNPKRNRYSYKMEGIDPRWVDAGTRRFVNYNLSPGNYIFKVKGCNNDGVWNNEGIQLSVTVVPPYWDTWWFRAIVIAGIAAGSLGAFMLKYRGVIKQRERLRQDVEKRTAELRESNDLLKSEVSGRLLAQQVLQKHRDELEAANRELEAFSYTLSHDLRNPLRVISEFTRLIKENQAERLGKESKRYLENIERNAVKMMTLIDDVLRLSRVGKVELERSKVNLSVLVRGIVHEFSALEPERRFELTVAETPIVYGDGSLLRIAIENLISNAWKFTRRQKVTRIDFAALPEDEGGFVTFFIRDNGVGFEAEDAGKLFVSFQRLHDEKEFEGTGVGLATVQQIIQRHGGSVWAEGESGRGAAFYFTLPVADPQREKSGEAEP